MNKWIRTSLLNAALISAGAGIIGCESNAGNGALIGGASGAGIGGLIGSYSHARAGEGALIGGAVGALGGALVGHEMDRQERDAYRRQSRWREEDYPVEYREYRYHRARRYEDDYCAPPPAPAYRYEYRETRVYRD